MLGSQKYESLISIIIVNFRTPQKTIDCLKSVLPQVQEASGNVIVVDNNSRDNSCRDIRQWLESNDKDNLAQLVETDYNGGYSFANNFGIKISDAKYILLLNSDTLVRAGAIQVLISTAEKYPGAGIVSPRIEWDSGDPQDNCFNFINPVGEFCKSAQTGLIDKALSAFVVATPIANTISAPQWTSFACALIRAEVFEDIGVLDEGYFMYFEDVEFCKRTRRAGWEILNDPGARVIHYLGGSSTIVERIRTKKRLPRFYYESRSRYFFQVFGRLGLMLANLMWLLGFVVSIIRHSLGRKDKALINSQWKDIWINFSHPLKPFTHPDTVHKS